MLTSIKNTFKYLQAIVNREPGTIPCRITKEDIALITGLRCRYDKQYDDYCLGNNQEVDDVSYLIYLPESTFEKNAFIMMPFTIESYRYLLMVIDLAITDNIANRMRDIYIANLMELRFKLTQAILDLYAREAPEAMNPEILPTQLLDATYDAFVKNMNVEPSPNWFFIQAQLKHAIERTKEQIKMHEVLLNEELFFQFDIS